MAKKLRRLHGESFITNAQLNRDAAIRCWKAGLTSQQIADEWPLVFRIVQESDGPKLGQIYDSEFADGRKETRYTITAESVTAAIHRLTGK